MLKARGEIMTDFGKLRYKVECTVCTRQFPISHLNDPLPNHAFKAEWERLSDHSSCLSSGTKYYHIIDNFTSKLE